MRPTVARRMKEMRKGEETWGISSLLALLKRISKPKLKLCPHCLNQFEQGSLTSWPFTEYYYCDKCGYSGSIALEPRD